jgi:mono/diheme cytochrome c family protein
MLGFSWLQAEPHLVGFERFYGVFTSSTSGAILYSELGCANCHGGSTIEVPRTGPILTNLGTRFSHEWVTNFLKAPQSAHEGSAMPQLTHGLSDAEILVITAYLGNMGEKQDKAAKSERHVNAEEGSALFHETGCVACHAPTPDYQGPHGSGSDFKSNLAVSFPDLKAKYSLASLEDFLANTSKYRPDGRMPHFPFGGEVALNIAAHLLDFQSSDPREAPPITTWPVFDKKAIEQGRTLVEKLNCAACHSLPGIMARSAAPLKTTQGPCLSLEAKKGLPHYDLSEKQRESLTAYIKGLAQPETPDKKNATFAALNCYACHDRDGIGGPTSDTNPFFVGDEALGDSGRLPPPLTGIGHKLQSEYLNRFLQGKHSSKVRPYLKTQMPKYPAQAKLLTTWLTQIDQPATTKPLIINADDIEIGKQLIGTHGGVNCIICHSWKDKVSLGIPGPDLSDLDQRLRPEWFRDYLLEPSAYRPNTLMPPLWPGGKSALTNVLNGETDRQIAAIWGYIKDGAGTPEGFPDQSSGKFELIPNARPIIQRAFLEKTGAKAILVGFPGQIHLAYDGLAARPSLVWKGRFFDAYSTWFTRAAPFEKPLGEDIYEFAPSSGSARFCGYKLDSQGNPTFLSTQGESKIEEHFEVKEGQLLRTITWQNGNAPFATHPPGVEMVSEITENKQIYIYFGK